MTAVQKGLLCASSAGSTSRRASQHRLLGWPKYRSHRRGRLACGTSLCKPVLKTRVRPTRTAAGMLLLSIRFINSQMHTHRLLRPLRLPCRCSLPPPLAAPGLTRPPTVPGSLVTEQPTPISGSSPPGLQPTTVPRTLSLWREMLRNPTAGPGGLPATGTVAASQPGQWAEPEPRATLKMQPFTWTKQSC